MVFQNFCVINLTQAGLKAMKEARQCEPGGDHYPGDCGDVCEYGGDGGVL